MILLDSDYATFLKYPDSERGRRFEYSGNTTVSKAILKFLQ